MTDAIIASDTESYYVGESLKFLTDGGTATTYTNLQGFVMSQTSSGSCWSFTYSYASDDTFIDSGTLGSQSYTKTTPSYTFASGTISSGSGGSVMNLDQVCPSTTAVTFTTPSVSSQTYTRCASALSIDTSAFAIAETCDDEAWTYLAEWVTSSGTTSVSENWTGNTYSISTTDSSLVGSYTVNLKGSMPD